MVNRAEAIAALPAHPRRRWAGRMAAALFGVLLAWLLLEVLLRVSFEALPAHVQAAIENVRVVPWREPRIVPLPPFNWDRDYERTLNPGLKHFKFGVGDESYHLDSYSLWGSRVGLRSDPLVWPVDIAVIGDSFAMCWVEWEDCWVEHLARQTGRHVMNLGQGATGTRAHLQMLKTFGIPLEPRVVIWQWYGNDFNDDYGLGLMRGEYAPLDQPPQLAPEPDFGPLARYSAVYALMRDVLWNATHEPPPEWGQWVTIHGERMRVGDDYNLYAFDLSRPSNARGYDLAVTALDESAQVIEQQIGAHWVIVLIPTKEEVYAPWLVETLGEAYLDRLGEGRRRMLALCEARGWRCLDVTPALRQAADAGEIVYHRSDLHINPRGNDIVAQAVADYLAGTGWLTGSP